MEKGWESALESETTELCLRGSPADLRRDQFDVRSLEQDVCLRGKAPDVL